MKNEKNDQKNAKDIEIKGRKYVRGDAGEAELCHLFCKERGRGHTHLTNCKAANPHECIEEIDTSDGTLSGRRHETKDYGTVNPQDEITHDYFWKKSGFMDPCTPESQIEFRLCSLSFN